MKLFVFSLFLILSSLSTYAHIGSPDIFYEGNAGPYKIQASIQPPDVVPGTAKIEVQVVEGRITKMTLQPIYYQYGSDGAPDADRAEQLVGTSNTFLGELWLMAFGSASVRITLEGEKGIGSTIVPVSALATATRQMDRTTEIILIPLGILLFAGLVTIMGVAVGQATAEPGSERLPDAKKRSRNTMLFFSVFLFGVLFFGKTWWDSVEAKYREYMYKPLFMQSEVSIWEKSGAATLVLHLQNRPWLERGISDIVLDHDKLMHLFVIREDGQAFAHLHPQQIDSSTYTTPLAPMDKGKYFLFADIVHENGLGETLVDSVVLKVPVRAMARKDKDDSWLKNDAHDSCHIQITHQAQDSLKSKRLTRLTFRVTDSTGKAIQPEPYLGMAGHAVVLKKDRSVFIHLHPMGTVSMASQNALASRVSGNVTLCNPLADSLAQSTDTLGLVDQDKVSLMKQKKEANPGVITFPYSFPKAGEYWIWVQVKTRNKIHTERFLLSVPE